MKQGSSNFALSAGRGSSGGGAPPERVAYLRTGAVKGEHKFGCSLIGRKNLSLPFP